MPARQGAKRNVISFNPCSCSPFCAVLVIGESPYRGPVSMGGRRLGVQFQWEGHHLGVQFQWEGHRLGAQLFVHTQRTKIARPNRIPPVGTLVRASASGEAPSRGPVVCTYTTHKHRATQPHPTCRDARSSVRKRRGTAPGPFTNVSKPHLLLGYLLAVHLDMRIKDAGQPLRG